MTDNYCIVCVSMCACMVRVHVCDIIMSLTGITTLSSNYWTWSYTTTITNYYYNTTHQPDHL